MAQNNTEQIGREQWGSRVGFMLAAMGSAVGLGNVWRFSYVAGENGGAAFLLLYILCIAFIGIPVMLAEFMIGRRAQSDVVGSFQKIAPGKPWILTGFIGVSAVFIILSFYGVVAGWTFHYLFGYLTGGLRSTPEMGFEGYFMNLISSPVEPIIWQFLFMVLTISIVYVGVKKGIETANKILMPTLAILLLLLAGYSLTLGGAKEGLAFLFAPDWSVLKSPAVYLDALGQAFFSLSLGMGALITYGGYLSKNEKLPSATLNIAAFDTLFAVVSGIMIFPAVFAFGIAPGSGPGLVFITLPDIFNSISFGGVVGSAFFFLLAASALSSSVSLLEVAVAYFMRQFNWGRQQASLIIGFIIFLVGIPSSLGFGVWSGVAVIGERNILDSLDFVASNILLPLGGLFIALFVGWGWKKEEALKESDLGQHRLGKGWHTILRYLAPVAILLIFLKSIGLF